MPRLTPQELQSRLRFDYEVVTKMRCSTMTFSAYRSVDDFRARRRPITALTEGHLATDYLVEYHIKTLVSAGHFSDRTLVHIDLLASGNYPYNEPVSWVISRPMPWSPHFHEKYPICTGEMWRQQGGNILLGHLIIHIAKLLNFDEVARGGGYVGYNAEATRYWTRELNGRPITPSLIYPVLPADLVHGEEPSVVFKPASTDLPFRPAPFRRVSG